MKILLKLLAPLLVFVIAYIKEHHRSDDRTKKNKIFRRVLMGLLILSTLVTMVIIYIDDKESQKLSNKIDDIPTELESIISRLKKNYKQYYDQARFNYNAGMMYQNLGMSLEAANAFLLFRRIALDVGEIQAAAGASIISSWRFEDIRNFTKAGELQSEAGDFYIQLNQLNEAKLWKRKAIENYEKANLASYARKIKAQIKQLE